MRRSYATQNLLPLTRATSCIQCRDSLVNSSSPWVFSQVATLQRVRENYNAFYAPDTTSKANAYLAAQVEQAEANLSHLQEFMELDLHNRSLETVQTLVERLEVYRTRLEENLRTLHEMAPELFEEKKAETPNVHQEPTLLFEGEQEL